MVFKRMESQTPLIAAAETAIVELSGDAITGRSTLSQKYRAYTIFSLLVMSAWSWFYMGVKNAGNISVPGGEATTTVDDVVVAEPSRPWHQRGGNLMVWFGDFTYGGVDHLLSGNGGAICMHYIPYWQRILETLLFLGVAGWIIRSSFADVSRHYTRISAAARRRRAIDDDVDMKRRKDSDDLSSTLTAFLRRWRAYVTNRVVFNAYFTVFALELLYKALTRTMIFLLNPCHLTTAIQLALMKFLVVEDDSRERRSNDKPTHQRVQRNGRLDEHAEPAAWYRNGEALASAAFLVHMYLIPGAILALFFPVLNTRLMMGEVMIYFVQHLFILFVPVYLIRQRPDLFAPEPFDDVSWAKFSVSALFIYHFVVLQFVSVITLVNLNGMLCPMVSDPFAGPVWRVCASLHQSVYIPLAAKFYALAARRLVAATEVVEAAKREL